ncbi:hypothetical protein MPSEU_000294700 [Mayamaea pseudoterrestris]|nr:hypothetical protein MPSEU_000294700 [Mayamaea pseudoterrestris]
MASSRWKRFAFFERHTLSLPTEVVEDLFVAKEGDNLPSTVVAVSSSNLAEDTAISLVVTTASLPLDSKPTPATANTNDTSAVNVKQRKNGESLQAFWSSLTACSATAAANTDDTSTAGLVHLPSQQQQLALILSPSNVTDKNISKTAEGLVLAFISSRDSHYVHCVDLTVRCNPPFAMEQDLDDLDGWRGYFAPFSVLSALVAPVTVKASASSSSPQPQRRQATKELDHVIGIAACRLSVSNNGTTHSKQQLQMPPQGPLHLACVSANQLVVWEDPHLHLSCQKPLPSAKTAPNLTMEDVATIKFWRLLHSWSVSDGNCTTVDIVPGMVAIGTDSGVVLVFSYNTQNHSHSQAVALRNNTLRPYLRIPAPPSAEGLQVVSVKLALVDQQQRASVFCAYRPKDVGTLASNNNMTSAVGLCSYDMALPAGNSTLSAPSARHDLDGRPVNAASLIDATWVQGQVTITVARNDGLYSYQRTERTNVAPVEGTKLAYCGIPPPTPAERLRIVQSDQVSSGYALVASTDEKSGRDAVDVYDTVNKLVAFHLLLSPGHRAVRAAGVATLPVQSEEGSGSSGRSSAVVLTSGGSLITLAEKLTQEKISLLVQKNLYSAAIVIAYADPSYDAADVTALFREYAEHLYSKDDYAGAMDQYIHTIGSLESSHVIFRFLDAPKIPLLVKYLEKLRELELATSVHIELLRTCYLKLNDIEAADALVASTSSLVNKASLSAILANISENPRDALATICTLDAQQVAEILVVHGVSLARVLPRETAGVVVALCVGKFSPNFLAEASLVDSASLSKMIELSPEDILHPPYPVHLFAPAFVENSKMLRLILAHCNRSRCYLTPSLRRTLLEVTLDEWKQAKRNGDIEVEKLRHQEIITALTDSHCGEIGEYDALVLVQLSGFKDGELLLYERLQMTPMLLERYAKDGSEKSRRALLAMSRTDPEVLADVLGHFVNLVGEKLKVSPKQSENEDDSDEEDEADEILEDIQEALALAKDQGLLPPVRVARILAGEGTGQFSEKNFNKTLNRQTVPLSVALDYVGSILEDSRKEISRLTSEVEEYNHLCNSMENEIDSLLRISLSLPSSSEGTISRLNIDEVYAKVRAGDGESRQDVSESLRENFWRDLSQADDRFDTIARYFAKGVIQ